MKIEQRRNILPKTLWRHSGGPGDDSGSRRLEKLKQKSDLVRIWVEILAIFVAGFWAFTIFQKKDAPLLAHRAKIESTVNWSDSLKDKKSCHCEYVVNLENIGGTTFSVTKARLRSWIFENLKLENNQTVRYFDADSIIRTTNPVFDKIYDAEQESGDNRWLSFLGQYTPGLSWKETFDFYFKSEPEKSVLFMFEVFSNDDHFKNIPDRTYQWTNICEN